MIPEDVVEDELDNVGDDEHGAERVQMDVKTICPLDILSQILILYQIFVAQIPEKRGNDQAHSDTINKEKVQEELYKGPEAQVKVQGERKGRETKPSGQKDQKSGVIARELTLRFLAVVKVLVHLLWRCEQVHHLPQRELKVHLFELEQASHIAIPLHCRRHASLVCDGRGEEGTGGVFA